MTGTEWLVTIGGAAAIAWVNWYFFLAQRGKATPTDGALASGVSSSAPAEVAAHARDENAP